MAEETKSAELEQTHFPYPPPSTRAQEYTALMDDIKSICNTPYATEEEQRAAVNRITALSTVRGFVPRADLLEAALAQGSELIVRLLAELGCVLDADESKQRLKKVLLSTALNEEQARMWPGMEVDSILNELRHDGEEARSESGNMLYREWSKKWAGLSVGGDISKGLREGNPEQIIRGLRNFEHPDASIGKNVCAVFL